MKLWQGIVKEYVQYLPNHITKSVVTLGEGGTPLITAPRIARYLEQVAGLSSGQVQLYIKFEGRNPTGSFKDRGMTSALSAQISAGVKVVICASTGNTSASAAAYATAAGIDCVVLVPDGKIAMGKLAQAIAHGAKVFQLSGNFDDCLRIARQAADEYPVGLVNSVNPDRIEGQKTASFEVVDELGDAPFIHALPVGNAGNIVAYHKGYKEYQVAGKSKQIPKMWGFQAQGAAPIVTGKIVEHPETIATAIRIGNPASWKLAEIARDESAGLIDAVSDAKILEAHRYLSALAGVFVEPASAAGLSGLFKMAEIGKLKQEIEVADCQDVKIVITCTGHGLKDPSWALNNLDGSPKSDCLPTKVGNSLDEVVAQLGL